MESVVLIWDLLFNIWTDMTRSLRSRQLISGFGVSMVGIVMLGSMLHWFSYRYKIEQEQSKLTEISYNVLGFLSFQNGKFDVLPDDDMRTKAKEMIEKYDLNNVEQNHFAYVIDTSTSQIIWSASSFGKPVRFLHTLPIHKDREQYRSINYYLSLPETPFPQYNFLYIDRLASERYPPADDSGSHKFVHEFSILLKIQELMLCVTHSEYIAMHS